MASLGIPEISPEFEAKLSDGLALVETRLREQIVGKYPLVIETSRHLVDAGGKRLRPLLTLIASHYGDPHRAQVIDAAVVCELTHLGTLYHDDVMDEAPLRRGVMSANTRWTNSVAILTGDYLFAKVSDLLADMGAEAVRLQARTFERLVIGQIMETQGPSAGIDALEHYLNVVADKTGSLIATSARFGALLSGAPRETMETLTLLGKTPGTDLREGVPTLVTLNVMKSQDPADSELRHLLSGPIEDETTVAQVLRELRQHKALDESRSQLVSIAKEARAALGPLPVGEPTGALLSLCDAVIDRTA